MHEARRQRLDAVNSGLPGVMWVILLPGARLPAPLPVLSDRGRALPDHVVGLAGIVAMVLFVIVSLNRPFHGAMAIPADSYQLIYDQLMKR
jgi:hypothetical protein